MFPPVFAYYGRVFATVARAMAAQRGQSGKTQILDVIGPIKYHTKVRLFDVDMNMHMNNARYLEAAEMGRFDMLTRSGLLTTAYKAMKDERSNRPFMPVLAGLHIKYIRQLHFREKFHVRSSICATDEKYIYFEQNFFKDKNNSLCAKVFNKAALLGRDFSELTGKKTNGPGRMRVIPPREIFDFLIADGYAGEDFNSYDEVLTCFPPASEDMLAWIRVDRPNAKLQTSAHDQENV